MSPRAGCACLACAICATSAWSDDFLDAIDQKLAFVSEDGRVRADVSFVPDFTLYVPDAPSPGLLFSNDETYFVPRLSTFFDAELGERVELHAEVRADRGFDPGIVSDGEVRIDEYFVRFELLDREGLNVRIGKFATNFGGWVMRHLAWENPLITAPLVYEDVMPVTDQAAPASINAFTARRDVKDNKPDWVPVVWGPSYTTGAAIGGSTDVFDFDIEIKNAALSSRPATWNAADSGFQTHPTVTGRVGWRPSPEWSLGTSYSEGPYMQDDAEPTLPPGANVHDFDQRTFGVDAAYAHHALELWSELINAEFDVPRVGEVEALSFYFEACYKVAPQVSIAARWNQSWYSDVPGLDVAWDRDAQRLDFALSYRHSMHVQTKLQYSIGDQAGTDTNGEHVFVAQLTLSF